MKYLPLIFSNLGRKKWRTALTLLSVFVAFTLFGVLTAIKVAFGSGVELTGLDRLLTLHKVSIIQPLPVSYKGRILATDGVVDVAQSNWFGGIYQDPKNFFPQYAVLPEEFLRLHPEFSIPEEQKQAWFQNRAGAVVGRQTAERFGWQIGDRIPIQGTIFQPPDGGAWEFDLEGIYDGAEKSTDETLFMLNYEYLEQALGGDFGLVGWYIVKIDDPQNAAEIAERIDSRFANSPAETRTSTEKAFIQSFANQTGNIAKMVTAIVSVVFFTLLLVAGNTMAQSVRERISELAVLKTLGFTGRQVMAMVLAESLALALLGGVAGLALVYWATANFELGGAMLPTLYMPRAALGLGFGLVLLLGLAAGLLPALQALRLKIVDALRRT